MTIFKGGWESIEELREEFWPGYNDGDTYKGELNGANILLVALDSEPYSESVFILLERDGLLFEVNGSHCSCMGFEGQWQEEATDKTALLYRMDQGHLGESYHDSSGEDFKEELKKILEGFPPAPEVSP